MTITTINELKQESYLMKNGETITNPIDGSSYKRKAEELSKIYNHCGSTLIFYDDDSANFCIPIPGNTLQIFKQILKDSGYVRDENLNVPLANGFSYPELKEKWDAIKKRVSLLA